MNYNVRLECLTCHTLIDCRIGMSNRDVQHLRFACPSCAEAIEIEINKGIKYKGVKNIVDFKGPFTGENPFVDLHQDFPVSFDKYVMGLTPFLRAAGRIGYENYTFHNHRLNALNVLYPLVPDLKRIIRLYSKNNIDLFCRLCESKFSETVKSKKPQDINAALYLIIAKVFFPFSISEDIEDLVHGYTQLTFDLAESDNTQFNSFIKEITETNFLKNLQIDCLEIYPRMFDAELPLRPALYLDFDNAYDSKVTAFRVSSKDFLDYKELYKDISEILSRQLILVAGLNNIIHRHDFNKFLDIGKHTPKNLHKYADVPYGSKLDFLDNSWYDVDEDAADNQLRNAVAHYKVEYDEVTQLITYFPRKEGIKQEKEEQIYFLDFMRKLLISYREMHKLHHLIKCLYYYYYLIYKK